MLFFAKKRLNAQAREHVCAGATVARGLRGCGAGGNMPVGGAGFFDGNGGARAAGVWRLLMDQVDLMDQMDKMGAPRYTPWVCMSLSGMARVMICRRGVLA